MSVASALVSSVLITFLWIFILFFESKKNGMGFVEYTTVVFQGSFKFVPYLPAIARGKLSKVNWTYFEIRNGSVGTIANALMDPLCKLKVVKLSNYSLKKMSRAGCKCLGNLLRTSNVNLIMSQRESYIKDLFEAFDITQSGCFDFEEFCRVLLAMKSFRAYSTNEQLFHVRIGMGSKQQSADSISIDNDNDKEDYSDYESDEDDAKCSVLSSDAKRKDKEKEQETDAMLVQIAERIRADRTWTDIASNVTIDELIESFDILADSNHQKVWLLDMLLQVRSSIDYMPCLDYDTPLYYAVKSSNHKMVTLLIHSGYANKNKAEFDHVVIECIVSKQYEMALMLCECKGVPIAVHIERGYNITGSVGRESKEYSMNSTRGRSGLMVDDCAFMNPFVTVSLFEQTATTDIIYHSDGNPLWHHLLLIIVPFECVDDYNWSKQTLVEQPMNNPLNPMRNKMKYQRSHSLSNEELFKQLKVPQPRISARIDTMNGLPMHVDIMNTEENPQTFQSMRTNLAGSPLIPVASPDHHYFHSYNYSKTVLSIDPLSLNDDEKVDEDDQYRSVLLNENKKKLVMEFKLFHHDYQSQMHSAASSKGKRKYFGDVEIGTMSLDLFDYERTFDKHLISLKKKAFKGYGIRDASLDCVIHLGAFKCYEQFGLKCIDKIENENKLSLN